MRMYRFFTPSDNDECLFFRKDKIWLLFGDDCLFFSRKKASHILDMITSLRTSYDLTPIDYSMPGLSESTLANKLMEVSNCDKWIDGSKCLPYCYMDGFSKQSEWP